MPFSLEALYVASLFVIPGFLGVQLFRVLVVDEEISSLSLTLWSVVLSVLALFPLLWLPFPFFSGITDYLFAPRGLLSYHGPVVRAFSGVFLTQIAIALALAWLAASIFNRENSDLHGLLRKRAWDTFWTRHGREKRLVTIETEQGLFSGTLYLASGRGRDVVLWEPQKYFEEFEGFYPTDMEFLFLKEEQIVNIWLSVEDSNQDDSNQDRNGSKTSSE